MARLLRSPMLWLAGGLAIGLAVVAGLVWLNPNAHVFGGVVQPEAEVVADVSLETRGEAAVRLSEFRGKYALVSFGYTFCPDVCPTTLAMLARLKEILGKDRERVAVAFVSIDPERDTPDRAADYAAGFNSTFVGLSGTPEQVAAAAAVFRVSYSRQEVADSAAGYLMNHTAFVYLLDPEGRWRITYPYGVEATDIAQDLEVLFQRDPGS